LRTTLTTSSGSQSRPPPPLVAHRNSTGAPCATASALPSGAPARCRRSSGLLARCARPCQGKWWFEAETPNPDEQARPSRPPPSPLLACKVRAAARSSANPIRHSSLLPHISYRYSCMKYAPVFPKFYLILGRLSQIRLHALSHCWYGAPLFIGVSILCSLSARVRTGACGGRPGGRSQSNAARPAGPARR
jgi:hypothetical protein